MLKWENVSGIPTSQTKYMIGYSYNTEKSRDWPMFHLQLKGTVFLPYCFGGHWCLLVLDVEKETITHYNPYAQAPAATRAIAVSKHYLKQCDPEKNNLCKINWRTVSTTTNRSVQNDTYNCGIFVIFYMDCPAKEKPLKDPDFNSDAYRSVISKHLISASKCINNICLYCERGNTNEEESITPCKICTRWAHKSCVLRNIHNKVDDYLVSYDMCILCYRKQKLKEYQ